MPATRAKSRLLKLRHEPSPYTVDSGGPILNDRLIARLGGALFITGTVSGILSVVLTRRIFHGEIYLAKIAERETQVVFASILVMIMAFTLAMIPIALPEEPQLLPG
jgi:hypothetical protein